LYNRYVILGLEVWGVLFWLGSFSLLATWTCRYNGRDYWYSGNSYGWWRASFAPQDLGLARRAYDGKRGSKYHAGVALAGTAAGLGAIEL
jgi:hypothetical protein